MTLGLPIRISTFIEKVKIKYTRTLTTEVLTSLKNYNLSLIVGELRKTNKLGVTNFQNLLQ
jgi:hypothetical protein